MKNLLNLLILLLFLTTGAEAQVKLHFNNNGEFKIVQFTDTHVDFTQNKNLDVYDNIKKVLQAEKPEFVILTGDIVTQNDPQEAYRRFANVFNEAKVPWAMVFGNHDSQANLSRKDLATFLKKLPGCLNDDKGKITGNSNFILPVYDRSNKPEALLYCMDSNAYSTLEPVVDGYGWFELDQINWYREKSYEYTTKNNGQPLPALAFFHIPLPEYIHAWENKTAQPIGVKNEDECSPEINTGMFSAMLESGDVMGTFVGHDHINDYIGIYYGMALAYGRVSKVMGDPGDPLAGGRVIVLKEDQRSFDTWIRQIDGKKVLSCTWPDSF